MMRLLLEVVGLDLEREHVEGEWRASTPPLMRAPIATPRPRVAAAADDDTAAARASAGQGSRRIRTCCCPQKSSVAQRQGEVMACKIREGNSDALRKGRRKGKQRLR